MSRTREITGERKQSAKFQAKLDPTAVHLFAVEGEGEVTLSRINIG